MKQILFGTLLSMFSICLVGQNALVGTGFSNGWGGGSCPTGAGDFKFFGAGISGTYILTTTANGTGNQFFRMGIDWSGTTAQRAITPGSDVAVTPGTKYTLNSGCTTSGAMVYNVPNAAYNYVFKTLNAGTNPTGDFVFFEVQGIVRSVSSVAQSPIASSVNQGVSVTVTATLSGAFASGQAAFLRYTTDNFATSTVTNMTGSGTTYTAVIPGLPQGTNVRYYVFTSGDVASISSDDADLYSINLNNNGGSNYSYTVLGPLPIELTDFRAVRMGTTIDLSWETASEQNNAYFEVEKSQDARTWMPIAKIEGNGTTPFSNTYAYVDAQPARGINYYRLRQVDTDAAFAFSKVVQVNFGRSTAYTLAPNPVVTDVLTVQLEQVDEEGAAVQLINSLGQVVHSMQGVQGAIIHIDVANLATGTYWLSVNEEVPVMVVKQ